MGSVARDTKKFHDVLARAGLSHEGRAWALMALDPFHDTEIKVMGCPNSQTGRSLVFDIRKTIAVAKPSTLATGNWDCHVALIPSCRMVNMKGAVQSFTPIGGVTPPTPNSISPETTDLPDLPEGVLVAFRCASGTNSFVRAPGSTAECSAISVDEYLRPGGRHAVVGCAFEVHNTTAEIYKQGSVTVYRHQNKYETGSMFDLSDVAPALVRFANAPPPTLAAAKQLGGVTWDAAQGALVPISLNHMDRPPGAFTPITTVLLQNNGEGYMTPKASPTVLAPATHLDFGLDSSGAYFTGLSNESTLEITLRCFLEIFPSPTDDLMALAQPSPPVDYKALELVSQIVGTIFPPLKPVANAVGQVADLVQATNQAARANQRLGVEGAGQLNGKKKKAKNKSGS